MINPKKPMPTAQQVKDALKKLTASVKTQKHQLFSEIYPDLLELIKSGATKKSVLKVLEEVGLSMSPATLNAFLKAEAEKRATSIAQQVPE